MHAQGIGRAEHGIAHAARIATARSSANRLPNFMLINLRPQLD
jgi:hypothetical protein